jgi:hypothetical protein
MASLMLTARAVICATVLGLVTLMANSSKKCVNIDSFRVSTVTLIWQHAALQHSHLGEVL